MRQGRLWVGGVFGGCGLGGGVCGGNTNSGGNTQPSEDTFEGNPSDPVTEAIPDKEYEVEEESFSDNHPNLPGLSISYNTLILAFTLDTTIEEANDTLDRINAEIVGGIPGVEGKVEGILFYKSTNAKP